MRKFNLFLYMAALTLVGCNQAFYSGYSDELYYTPSSQKSVEDQTILQEQPDAPMTQEQFKQNAENNNGIYDSESLQQSSDLSQNEADTYITFSLMSPGFYTTFNNMYYNDWYYPYYGSYARYRWIDYGYWDWWYSPYYSYHYNPWGYHSWHWGHYPYYYGGWSWHDNDYYNHYYHRQYVTNRQGLGSNRASSSIISGNNARTRANARTAETAGNSRPTSNTISRSRETQVQQQDRRQNTNIATGRTTRPAARPTTTVDNNKIRITGREQQKILNNGAGRTNNSITNQGRLNNNTTINNKATTLPNNDRTVRPNNNNNRNNNRNNYNYNNNRNNYNNNQNTYSRPPANQNRQNNSTISRPPSGGGRSSGISSPSGGGRSGGNSGGRSSGRGR